MRRTSRLVLLLGIFLAALTFVVVLLIRPGTGPTGNGPGASPTLAVNLPTVVAAADIPLGTVLTDRMLGVRYMPEAYVEFRHIRARDASRIIGVRMSMEVKANESILWSDLATTTGERRDLSSLVRSGMRAITIRADATSGFAVTDPAAGKKGISAFLVPTGSSGYSVDKIEHKLGQAASDTCAIRFDDLFVEDGLLFGAEGRGYNIALANLEQGRIGIAAQCVGMAQAALEIAVAYARDRRSMGKPIIEHQAVGFRLADLATRLEAARQLVLHAASVKDAGLPCLKEASMAKLFASEAAEAIVSGAIQTLGGYGYLEEFGLAKIYRDVRVCQIYEGTSDIQRMVIARAL